MNKDSFLEILEISENRVPTSVFKYALNARLTKTAWRPLVIPVFTFLQVIAPVPGQKWFIEKFCGS